MDKLPVEIIQKVLSSNNDIKEIKKICDTNKRNNAICEDFFLSEIKKMYKSSFDIYYELSLKISLRIGNSEYKIFNTKDAVNKYKTKITEYINKVGNLSSPFRFENNRQITYYIYDIDTGFIVYISYGREKVVKAEFKFADKTMIDNYKKEIENFLKGFFNSDIVDRFDIPTHVFTLENNSFYLEK